MPRCGALSLLQKDAALQGDPAEIAARLKVKLRDLRGGVFLPHAKGRLEIGKPAPMVPTYLVLSGKKSARSPPAEIFNSKNHAQTHEPPS